MLPLDGESFLSLLEGRSWERQQPIFFEHEGNCAVRIGNFKLVREFNRSWELYDIVGDRTELKDLAGSDRRRAESMQAVYEDWASRTGVQDWNRLLPKLQEIWEMSDVVQT
jgi:arylsulfatase